MTPGFKPTALKLHDARDADYKKLEAAAKAGEKPQQAIWKRFEAAWQMIQADGQWGDVIRKSDIPAYFQTKYRATNLYCISLKGDVRCFYTIVEQDIIFLDIVHHDQYDKWFPPRGQRRRRA